MKYQAKLMGVNFRPADAKALVEDLEVGDDLALVRDPENPYDRNAIQVHYDEEEGDPSVFIGFVQKEVAAVIAEKLDAGEAYSCKVFIANPKQPMLEIQI